MKFNRSYLGLVAALALGACGIEEAIQEAITLPAVSEARIVGITPAPDFETSATVKMAVIPKDASGNAIIKYGLKYSVIITDVTENEPAFAPKAETQITASVGGVETNEPDLTKPVSVAIDLDSSGSMAGTDPEELRKDAAKLFVDVVPANASIGVFDFGAGATDDFTDSRKLNDFSTDKAAAKTAIDEIEASGGTPMYESVVEVIEYFDGAQSSASFSRSMLLLGDGQPNWGDVTEADACAAAVAAGIPINTIGFGPAADLSPQMYEEAVAALRNLANCSGGTYVGVATPEDISNAFDGYGEALKHGTVDLSVKLSAAPAPGSIVSGELVVSNGKDKGARVKFSFRAPKKNAE
jgi:hypothetical protein